MAVKRIVTPERFIGASTDTKPTDGGTSVRPGATFYERDTGQLYITNDGTNWIPKRDTTGFLTLGHPEIRCDNEGWGQWENKALQAKFKDSYDTNRQFRYGNWAVHLNGGPQASGESWASISVPINELKVSDLAKMEYTWYNYVTGTAHIGSLGPNFVWSAYDPDDHSKRVDFNTLATQTIDANPAAGWHEYLLTNTDTSEVVFWYGNNTGTHDTAPDEGAQTHYWSSYITDTVFKDWVIYRVQIMTGYWGSTRSTGDVWIGGLKINGIPVKWEPSEAEKTELFEKERNILGKPTLSSNNNSKAKWFKTGTSPFDQKSSTSYLAHLHGGVQTGWNDWARINIPVNEMRVPDLKTAMWSYYMTATDTFGVNMVIFVHDPFDPDNRAEITQQANIATLAKAGGWNSHVLNPETAQFYFYADGTVTNTNLTKAAPNYYAWNHHTSTTKSFVTDELFNTWTIYRITFDFGWQGSGTFGDAYIADIQINGQLIPLYPDTVTYHSTVNTQKTLDADAQYTANDVMSEAESDGTGTDWDFEFGGIGKIVEAIVVTPTTGLTAALHLYLYDSPPTCELHDQDEHNGPLVADMPYFVGVIEFPALIDIGSGPSYARATNADAGSGGLPLYFDKPILYGVLVDTTGQDFSDGTTLDIILKAECEV